MRIDRSREGGPEPESRSEEDRVVSRRVQNPTEAAEEDHRTYEAATRRDADDTPEGTHGPAEGGTAERADHDLAADDESEPDRSE